MPCETKETYIMHPFEYTMDDKQKFTTFQTLRNAQYTECADEVFNNKKLDEDALKLDTFLSNMFEPTPQLKYMDGYDSAATAEEGGDDGSQGGEDQPQP